MNNDEYNSQEEPTEIQERTKAFLQVFYDNYLKEAKQLANIEQRHKQNILDLVRRTSNPYKQIIIKFLQDEWDHWLKLSEEDIEYMQAVLAIDAWVV